MESFNLSLKNEKINSYNKIGYLVAGVNFIFFIFYTFYAKPGSERFLWSVFSLLIPVICFADISIRKKKFRRKFNISITYCWLMIGWWEISIWMMLGHIILLLSDNIARRKLDVNFNKDGIVYPSFPKKNIPWNTLENVVLKDGLLTIDFKNNRLLQSEIEASGNQIDETTFNRYCEQQIKL
jgi:hypothetical protein